MYIQMYMMYMSERTWGLGRGVGAGTGRDERVEHGGERGIRPAVCCLVCVWGWVGGDAHEGKKQAGGRRPLDTHMFTHIYIDQIYNIKK